MASLKALCLAGVASFAVTAPVFAADLPLPLPPPPPIYEQPVAVVGGGWYLRGDAGEGNLQLRGMNSSFNPDFAYGTPDGKPPGFATPDHSVTEQAIADVGLGYQFNNYFRADVTGEYRFASRYKATESYSSNNLVASGCATCFDNYRGNITSGVFLVNGYVDLGTWYHATPYFGVGVGVAMNHVSSVTDYNAAFHQDLGGSQASTHSSLAYAIMAGVSYELTNNLKLDIGYRYLDMGRARTGVINCYGGTPVCGDDSRETQSFRLSSHDIRVGLRYQFADIIPYQQRAPIIARY